MQRLVEPEWLDSLAPSDPRARGSRRDLRRVNWIMGNARLTARALVRGAARPPSRIVDIGAGDGAFSLSLARRLAPRWPGLNVVLVDRAPAVEPATLAAIRAAGWKPEIVAADVFDWCRRPRTAGEAVVANLFLHHFDDAALGRLLAALADGAAIVAACEPRRSALALAGSRLLGLIGCNDVTRHDAVVSVRAGFTGREISALWPQVSGWRLAEGPANLTSHLFVAAREAA